MVMSVLAYSVSMIYFSVLGVYNNQAWKLPPYDAATAAMQRVAHDIREAMQVDTDGTSQLIVTLPLKDANHDDVLTLVNGQYVLSLGDQLAIYLSDSTGAMNTPGTCLWEAVEHPGSNTYTHLVKIADNIDPTLNPINPATGNPHIMFTYWPDTTHLWGVEMWMTSTAKVYNKTVMQTAHSESFFRNL